MRIPRVANGSPRAFRERARRVLSHREGSVVNSRPCDRSRQIAFLVATVLLLSNSFTTGRSVDYGGYRPHYQGYGVNTPGGRGGEVCRVTSLSDSV